MAGISAWDGGLDNASSRRNTIVPIIAVVLEGKVSDREIDGNKLGRA